MNRRIPFSAAIQPPSDLRAFIVLLAAATLVAGCISHDRPSPRLAGTILGGAFGADANRETWISTRLAPGLSHHRVRIAASGRNKAAWSLRSPPLRTGAETGWMRDCLSTLGTVEQDKIYAAGGRTVAGFYRIASVGRFDSEDEAKTLNLGPGAARCGLLPQFTGYEPDWSGGPWTINIIEIDPQRFAGQLSAEPANDLAGGAETVVDISARTLSLAAMNASFFVMHDTDGFIGDIAGLAVKDGRIMSEPTRGRFAFVIENGKQISAKIRLADQQISVDWSDQSATVLDGVNRLPGRTRNCGNTGDRPVETPAHDLTCEDDGEIVLITKPALIGAMPPGVALAVLDTQGAIAFIERDQVDARHSSFLVAHGDRIDELGLKASLGLRGEINPSLIFAQLGVPQMSGVHAVSGGPVLVLNGSPQFELDREGWAMDWPGTSQARAEFIHAWVNLRNPRTAVGIRADRRIILVTVDGRNPEISAGATIDEMRDVMRLLGSVDALNLDGGGSTTMVIAGKLANTPSDPSGARAVGDALVINPALAQTTRH